MATPPPLKSLLHPPLLCLDSQCTKSVPHLLFRCFAIDSRFRGDVVPRKLIVPLTFPLSAAQCMHIYSTPFGVLHVPEIHYSLKLSSFSCFCDFCISFTGILVHYSEKFLQGLPTQPDRLHSDSTRSPFSHFTSPKGSRSPLPVSRVAGPCVSHPGSPHTASLRRATPRPRIPGHVHHRCSSQQQQRDALIVVLLPGREGEGRPPAQQDGLVLVKTKMSTAPPKH